MPYPNVLPSVKQSIQRPLYQNKAKKDQITAHRELTAP